MTRDEISAIAEKCGYNLTGKLEFFARAILAFYLSKQ